MKIAIYFSHYETLGHTTRVYTLIKGLKKAFKAKILVLRSGKRQRSFELERYSQIVDLPFSIGRKWFKLERRFKFDEKTIKLYKVEELFRRRVDAIKEKLSEFKPDIFITEFYPFGREFWAFELKYIFDFLKSNFQTKIFSSVGYPFCEEDTAQLIRFYDACFFHCSVQEIDYYMRFKRKNRDWPRLMPFSDVLEKEKKKIHCTGYLLEKKRLSPPSSLRKRLRIGKDRKFVVVSRGGGVDYNRIVTSSILAAKRLKDIFFLISTGPATTKAEFDEFRRMSAAFKNIKLVKYLADFEDYLNASDLSINMAGSNTMIRLLWLKKQSITIPLESPEQRCRVEFFKRFHIFRSLDYNKLNTEKLIENIKNLLVRPMKPSSQINEVNFNGLENTLRILRCLT